jgi:hypothetical protein
MKIPPCQPVAIILQLMRQPGHESSFDKVVEELGRLLGSQSDVVTYLTTLSLYAFHPRSPRWRLGREDTNQGGRHMVEISPVAIFGSTLIILFVGALSLKDC